MTKSILARFVRASAVNAKQAGCTMKVYGLDAYSLQSYGFVSKEGHFWRRGSTDYTNADVVRLIANTIGMNNHTAVNRRAVLNAINHFKKGL